MEGEKIKVQVNVTARINVMGEVEMTRAQYEAFCERIDNASGFERERVAEEVMEMARLDISTGDLEDIEVEDFVEV